MWHKADWDKVAKNPESIQFPRQDWIFMFDAEKEAEKVFDEESMYTKMHGLRVDKEKAEEKTTTNGETEAPKQDEGAPAAVTTAA